VAGDRVRFVRARFGQVALLVLGVGLLVEERMALMDAGADTVLSVPCTPAARALIVTDQPRARRDALARAGMYGSGDRVESAHRIAHRQISRRLHLAGRPTPNTAAWARLRADSLSVMQP